MNNDNIILINALCTLKEVCKNQNKTKLANALDMAIAEIQEKDKLNLKFNDCLIKVVEFSKRNKAIEEELNKTLRQTEQYKEELRQLKALNNINDYITTKELAKKWKCSTRWICKLAHDKRIDCIKIGGRIYIKRGAKRPKDMRKK